MKVEVSGDDVDRIVIIGLRETLKHHTDSKWKEPDSDEIAAACRLLLKYYRTPKR